MKETKGMQNRKLEEYTFSWKEQLLEGISCFIVRLSPQATLPPVPYSSEPSGCQHALAPIATSEYTRHTLAPAASTYDEGTRFT